MINISKIVIIPADADVLIRAAGGSAVAPDKRTVVGRIAAIKP